MSSARIASHVTHPPSRRGTSSPEPGEWDNAQTLAREEVKSPDMEQCLEAALHIGYSLREQYNRSLILPAVKVRSFSSFYTACMFLIWAIFKHFSCTHLYNQHQAYQVG